MYGFIFGSRYRNYYCSVPKLSIIYKQKIRNHRQLAIVSDYLLLVEMAETVATLRSSLRDLRIVCPFCLRKRWTITVSITSQKKEASHNV